MLVFGFLDAASSLPIHFTLRARCEPVTLTLRADAFDAAIFASLRCELTSFTLRVPRKLSHFTLRELYSCFSRRCEQVISLPAYAAIFASFHAASYLPIFRIIHMLMRPQWALDKQLRARRLDESDSPPDTSDFRVVGVPDVEERSISNTAVDSDSGSRREI